MRNKLKRPHKKIVTEVQRNRVRWLRSWYVSTHIRDREKKEELGAIRGENATALSYTSMWIALVSVIFALIGGGVPDITLARADPSLLILLLGIKILFLASIVILMVAAMLFWHGCSTDHPYEEYVALNENGDSLAMLGSLVVLVALCLLFTHQLLLTDFGPAIDLPQPITKKLVSFVLPIGVMGLCLTALNWLSMVTQGRRIVFMHYFVEAARAPFYGNLNNRRSYSFHVKKSTRWRMPEDLIEILRGRRLRYRISLFVIVSLLLAPIVIAFFTVK